MITSLSTVEIGPGLARVVAVSDEATPVFTWYVNGALFLEGDVSGSIELPALDLTDVQVFDQDGGQLEAVGGGGMLVQWQASRDADGDELAESYRVDVWDGAAWVADSTVEASGVRAYEIRVPAEDQTSLLVRVVATDPSGVDTTLVTRAALVVRTPDVPDQTVSVSDGTLSVGA